MILLKFFTYAANHFGNGEGPPDDSRNLRELAGELVSRVQVQLRAIALFDVGSFTYTASHVERYPTYVRTPR